MEFRSLGKTGVQVSNPCLGTMTFGWAPDDWGSTEAESFKIADAAFELGINFYDTADVYARGVSETILGKWMSEKKKSRVSCDCHKMPRENE
ncbi:aldo/keto reductase [Kamptonema cortianum]|nr:aldo/keto reductase [Geitlerinema splendidum]MDK3156153.1 aldo/keto reductase [Kamptonema cortianum]